MAKKKQKSGQKQLIQDAPINRVEAFLERNVLRLAYLLGGAFLLFVLAYGGYSLQEKTAYSKVEEIGAVEIALMREASAEGKLEILSSSAKEIKLPDYLLLTLGYLYVENGLGEDALNMEYLLDGFHLELLNGRIYDAKLKNIDVEYYVENGMTKEVWHYRAVLNADEGDREELMERFALLYPNSSLLDLLKKWI